MSVHQAVVIGCGGQGQAHANGYAREERARLTAVCDPVPSRAEDLASKYPGVHALTDAVATLREYRPEIVSICTPTALHPMLVEAAIKAGARAIHCEKPMAQTYGEARRMHEMAMRAGTILTICHQRRFEVWYRTTRDMIREKTIGELVSMEAYTSNLLDMGTHWFDLLLFFVNDRKADWVMGQIDGSANREAFGVPVETNALSFVHWPDGVTATLLTGRAPQTPVLNKLCPRGFVIHGEQGRIEMDWPKFVVHRFGQPDLTPEIGRVDAVAASISDLIDCLENGSEPELASVRALHATELIFATYESSRRRSRIILPLEIDDSPFLSGLRDGMWMPQGPVESAYG